MDKILKEPKARFSDMNNTANSLIPVDTLVMTYALDVETQCVHPMLPFYQPSSG